MNGLTNLLKGRNRLFLMSVAVLWVTAFHYAMYGNLLRVDIINLILGKGYLGVDVFFFLSAYGLCYSFQDHSISDFYIRRIKRLYPQYLVFLVVLLLAFSSNFSLPWYKVALFQGTGLMSFTQNDIEWYVPALIVLYLCFPLLYKLTDKIYKAGELASCALIFAIALLVPFTSHHMFYLFPPRFIIIFVGIMTYMAVRDRNERYLHVIYAFCAILGIFYLGEEKINVSLSGSLFIPILLYLLGQLPVNIKESKVLDFIGANTLEIYLAQNLAFNHYMFTSDSKSFVETSLVSFGIIIFATALFVFSRKLKDVFSKSSSIRS